MDSRHDVLAVDENLLAFRRSQRDVQHGALFADIDCFAAEHGLDVSSQPALPGQFDEQSDRLRSNPVLRVVEVKPDGLRYEAASALRIVGEEFTKVRSGDPAVMLLQRDPRWQLRYVCHIRQHDKYLILIFRNPTDSL
jgi:hypothetical protein